MADEDYSDDESIDSQLEWELDEGIPQFEDPFIEKYLTGRDALIEQEKKQRHDRLFIQTMSPIARQAAKIVAAIRKRELQSKWTPQYEAALGEKTDTVLFPGMMFNLARDKMESTDLWRVIAKMPKGALLHAHMDAMFDVDWLIDQILEEPGVCMFATEGLSNETKRTSQQIHFKYFPSAEIESAKGAASIWSDQYVANTPVSVTAAQHTFPNSDGATFKSWLTSRCTITLEESLCHHHGLDAIWKKFSSTFPIVHQMVHYEPIFRRAMQRLLGQLMADGIVYCEVRLVFVADFFLQKQTTPIKGYVDWFRIVDEEVEKFKISDAGKTFRGLRIIWTTLRMFGNKAIAEDMRTCIAMKRKFPHLLAGYDFVGQEDSGRPLADLVPMIFWFKKQCHEAGVDLPFFFHAGECLGDGDSTDNNLFDAILLGTRRIGHGYSLYKHPLLIDMVKQKRIMIESCPISNEILRLSSSILGHALPALLSRGVACSLNNDDPAILGHGKNGLSHDFWQTLMGWENLGLEGLATMAENSIKYCAVEDQSQKEWIKGIDDSYLGETTKAEMLREWRTEFEKWCQWVIMEYPLEADSEEEGDGLQE